MGKMAECRIREGVYYNGAIHFHGAERLLETPKKDDDLNLLLDTINEGGQCLVFVSSRRSAEAYAKRAAMPQSRHDRVRKKSCRSRKIRSSVSPCRPPP